MTRAAAGIGVLVARPFPAKATLLRKPVFRVIPAERRVVHADALPFRQNADPSLTGPCAERFPDDDQSDKAERFCARLRLAAFS